MAIDKKFIDQFINVTSKAALASSYLVGKKDKIAADKAATDAMRSELNKIEMNGKIVIGEGELDESPMLYIGELVGKKIGPNFDIAVDPLEGTNFAANSLPGALSVIAVAEKNNLFKAPETYMEKISTKVNEKHVVDLDYTIKQNISNLCDYLNKNPENMTACILDRPRHNEIIEELKKVEFQKKNTQPSGVATGGSTFKNPKDVKAWELINSVGLSGFQLGGAMISPDHNNFFVNTGNASASDIEDLGNLVIEKVKNKHGVILEWEIRIVGDR